MREFCEFIAQKYFRLNRKWNFIRTWLVHFVSKMKIYFVFLFVLASGLTQNISVRCSFVFLGDLWVNLHFKFSWQWLNFPLENLVCLTNAWLWALTFNRTTWKSHPSPDIITIRKRMNTLNESSSWACGLLTFQMDSEISFQTWQKLKFEKLRWERQNAVILREWRNWYCWASKTQKFHQFPMMLLMISSVYKNLQSEKVFSRLYRRNCFIHWKICELLMESSTKSRNWKVNCSAETARSSRSTSAETSFETFKWISRALKIFLKFISSSVAASTHIMWKATTFSRSKTCRSCWKISAVIQINHENWIWGWMLSLQISNHSG